MISKKSILGERPKSKYRSVTEYAFRHGQKEGKPNCPICHGSGRIIAPWEQSDPVEGYKMADRIQCYGCQGKKTVDPIFFKEDFDLYRQKIKNEQEKWDHDSALLTRIFELLDSKNIPREKAVNLLRRY